MKKLALLLLLIFSTSALAQEPKLKLRPKKYSDIVKSANAIRAKESEIREFYMQLVLRKAQMDVAAILKKQRMADEDVQKVLDSEEMKHFLSRVENNPKIQKRVDFYVRKLTKPGAIEAHVMEQRQQMIRAAQERVIMARNNLQKSKIFRTEEKVLDPVDDRSLSTKVWDHLVADLYKE